MQDDSDSCKSSLQHSLAAWSAITQILTFQPYTKALMLTRPQHRRRQFTSRSNETSLTRTVHPRRLSKRVNIKLLISPLFWAFFEQYPYAGRKSHRCLGSPWLDKSRAKRTHQSLWVYQPRNRLVHGRGMLDRDVHSSILLDTMGFLVIGSS